MTNINPRAHQWFNSCCVMLFRWVWVWCPFLLWSPTAYGFQTPPLPLRHSSIVFQTDPQQQELDDTKKNPVDGVLSFIVSDSGSVILGSAGLLGLLLVRGSIDATNNAEELTNITRETLLAVLSIGAVLLNGLSQMDVPTALAETVELEGMYLAETLSFVAPAPRTSWILESLIQATPAATAVLLECHDDGWQMTAAVGVLPESALPHLQVPSDTPILDRFRKTVNGESYLPTLQALPGKAEFTYLPTNAQAALILSPQPNVVVVLGSNRARCFTPRDIAWCQAVVSRAVYI